MITFGNEELLADGREDLPRIINIARPTRFIIESTKYISEAFGSLDMYIQIILHDFSSRTSKTSKTTHVNLISEQTPVAGSLQSALWRRLIKVFTT